MLSCNLFPSSHIERVVCTDSIFESFETILKEWVADGHFYPATEIHKLLDRYSASELSLIYQDLLSLKEMIFREAELRTDYVVTAGGPGSGKSTLLESCIKSDPCKRAYIDPDRVCLFNMEKTYVHDIAGNIRNKEEAYTHWRDASNFCANVFLAYALKNGYAIAHGSTMTHPKSGDVLANIQNYYDYSTRILHLTCSDQVRITSEEKRKQHVVQVTPEDLVAKGQMFFERLPAYLTSNELYFYLRTDLTTVVKVAEKRGKDFSIMEGQKENLAAIQALHDQKCSEGFWEKQTGGE